MPDKITDGRLFNRFMIAIIIIAGKRIERSRITYISNRVILLFFIMVVSIKDGSSPLTIPSAKIMRKQEIIFLG
jgi:hypothetical protein